MDARRKVSSFFFTFNFKKDLNSRSLKLLCLDDYDLQKGPPEKNKTN